RRLELVAGVGHELSAARLAPARVRRGAAFIAVLGLRETGVVRVHQARHEAILRRSSVRVSQANRTGLARSRAGGRLPPSFTWRGRKLPRTSPRDPSEFRVEGARSGKRAPGERALGLGGPLGVKTRG